MDDLISRQAAIDTLKGLEFHKYMEFGEYIGEDTREVRLIRAEKAQDALQDLPSAQLERDCMLKQFGKCSYNETGCSDCKIKAKIRTALTAQPEQRWIPCGKCIHADGKHRWCKVLDRTINEDYFCYWAEPFRGEGEADG